MMDADEGIILQGAQRILDGEVLYRDFFSYFTPGSYYLLAGIFKIFGSSMLVARTAVALYGSVFPVVSYGLARRVCSRRAALVTAGLVTLTCLPYRFLVLHNWDSTLWACMAVYCAVRYLESRAWGWALGTGSFTALTILFEQSKGAGLALGLGAGFALIVLAGRKVLFDRKEVIALVAGFAWPFVLTLAWFASQHAVGPMLTDLVWPLQHYSLANRVPYGYQNWSDSARAAMFGTQSWGVKVLVLLVVTPCFLLPVLPLVAIGFLGFTAARTLRARHSTSRDEHFILVSAALSGLLLSIILVRADILHFVYLSPLFFLVLAWVFDGRDIRSELFAKIRPALGVFLILVFGLLSAALAVSNLGARIEVDSRRGILRASAPDNVVSFVQAHVAPGSKIFVYPYLPLYYYLTDTRNPTPYEYIQPGMHTPEQLQDVVDKLSHEGAQAVLFQPDFSEKIAASWPETALSSAARDRIAEFILSDYHPCRVLISAAGWRFVYMMRKGKPCP